MAASAIASSIVSALKAAANPTKAQGTAKYFKHVCEFHGVSTKGVQEITKAHLDQVRDLVASEGRQPLYDLVKELIPSKHHEEKQIISWMMNLVLEKKPFKLAKGDLDFLGTEVFDKRHAYDWATVDTLCGRVLHYVLLNDGNSSDSPASQELKMWAQTKNNDWKQRASCVAFVKLAKHGKHDDVIIEIASHCVQNPERFVQLGCGWMLREMFLSDPERVVEFITSNYGFFSREGLRYAIEKMDDKLRSDLLAYNPSAPTELKIRKSKAQKKREHDEDEEEPPKKRSKRN